MASPEFLKLLDRLRERPRGRFADVERQRREMEAVAFPVGDDVAVTVTTIAGMQAEWVVVPEAGEGVMLYLHGGGFVMGSPNTHRKLAGDFSRAAGVRILLLDYPLAPERRFPAAIHSVVAAYEALRQETPAHQIVIAGDSAGGTD